MPVGRAVRLARAGLRGADAAAAEELVRGAYSQRASSRALRKQLGAESQGGYAHHIVAWGDKRTRVSKNILLAHGLGPNDALNGVIIRKAGNHPSAYYNAVEQRLKRAVMSAEGQGWLAERAAIRSALRKLGRDIRSGKLKT
jgi:hypothetical protein